MNLLKGNTYILKVQAIDGDNNIIDNDTINTIQFVLVAL